MDDGSSIYLVWGGLQTNAWGKPWTLQDHFDDHGSDFGSRSPDEYAQEAQDFLLRSQAQGLPTKIDSDGVIRVIDPATGEFGAYNADGTTRTYYIRYQDPVAYFGKRPGIAPEMVEPAPVQLRLPFLE